MTDGSASPAVARSRARTALFALLASLIGLAAAALLLEGALRLLPLTEPRDIQPVTENDRYLHFRPNNDVLYSFGRDFAIINRFHVNNVGFVNDQDYDRNARSPLLAVIGDSFVEAVMVPYRETLQGRLAAMVGSGSRVYSFASSGSALSQYLAYAEYARDRFRPDALAVVVVSNDFDESLLEYKSNRGYHYLKRNADGSYSLHLVPWSPRFGHRVLIESALIRYLKGLMPDAMRQIRSIVSGEEQFVANVRAEADAPRIEKSKEAIDFFLTALPRYSGLKPERIVFVIDGIRPQLYDSQALESVRTTYFGQMREYLMSRARDAGYAVADLQPRFMRRFAREGIRFEWEFNMHWNSVGHEEAACAVLATGVSQRVFAAAAGLDYRSLCPQSP